jgi:DNA-binding MarR family transcriptional regulator
MARRDPLQLDEQLCFALYSASRAMTRTYAPLLEPLGVTYPQYVVLLVLWERDGVPIHELGTRLALDSGTLTPLLKRLERQGLVERRRGVDDERVVRIHLTASGRALRLRARKIPADLACRAGYDAGSDASMHELTELRDQLIALTVRLGGGATEPPEQ